MGHGIRSIVAAFCMTVAGQSAMGDALPSRNQSDSEWRYDLLLYAFAPLRTWGTSTVAGRSAGVDLDLNTVLDNLNFAASGRFEAWRGDLGFIFDANYYELDAGGSLPGPAGGSASVNVRQKWLALMAAYRVAHGTYGQNGQEFAIDVQGGARYNSIRQEVRITSPLPIPTLGGDEGWWEAVIGVRGKWRLNDRWAVSASADFGGFGAGGNDLQTGVNLGFEYQPWESTSLVFGYRYFSMDYKTTLPTGDFAYDVEQHGPVIGVKFRF